MKKITLPIVIATTVILLIISLSICAYSYSLNMERLLDENVGLQDALKKRNAYILDENKGLTLQQFKEKHAIMRALDAFETEGNMIYYNRLYFQFNSENGLLESVE